VIERDEQLLERLQDLDKSLAPDIAWLLRNPCGDTPRADGLRDLGERLSDLGEALLKRSDELDRHAAVRLPPEGWIPEAGPPAGRIRAAHYVGRGELRYGPLYLATCGAPCLPFYGKDPIHRIARHPRCTACTSAAASPELVSVPAG
jgi:hypothetical protein